MKKEYVSPTFTKTMFISLDNISTEDDQGQVLEFGVASAPSFPMFSANEYGIIFDDPEYANCSCKECFSKEMCMKECSDGCNY